MYCDIFLLVCDTMSIMTCIFFAIQNWNFVIKKKKYFTTIKNHTKLY